MLLLLFHMGSDRYAIETNSIIEVLPLVSLTKLEQVPDYIAGFFIYRGHEVPVIDLRRLIQGQWSQPCLSTRLLALDYTAHHPELPCIGLMVERVIDTLKQSELTQLSQNFQLNTVPYLEEVMTDQQGFLQKVNIDALLSKSQQELIRTPLDVSG